MLLSSSLFLFLHAMRFDILDLHTQALVTDVFETPPLFNPQVSIALLPSNTISATFPHKFSMSKSWALHLRQGHLRVSPLRSFDSRRSAKSPCNTVTCALVMNEHQCDVARKTLQEISTPQRARLHHRAHTSSLFSQGPSP